MSCQQILLVCLLHVLFLESAGQTCSTSNPTIHPSWPQHLESTDSQALATWFKENSPKLKPQPDLTQREIQLIKWSLIEYIEARKANNVTCFEYASVLVKRMKFYEDCAIFMVTTYKRTEQILEAAKEMDKRAETEGIESIAPLYGLPVPVKGTLATKEFESSCGSSVLDQYLAVKDAALVDLLKSKNAVIMGKTNVPDFAASWITMNPRNGRVINPYSAHFTSGGSSGGSAAAVSFYISPLSTTEDTGGSTRHPAVHNQLYAYDPTRNHYPNEGNPGFSRYRDQTGVVARSLEDIIFFDSVLLSTEEEHNLTRTRIKDEPCLAVRIGFPLFPFVEFELPSDASNLWNLPNMTISESMRAKYEDVKLMLQFSQVTIVNEEFPEVFSPHFNRSVNSLLDSIWAKKEINGKEWDGVGVVDVGSFTGQIAQWVHQYLDADVSNKRILEAALVLGDGHNPHFFFNSSFNVDESQLRYASISQRDKLEVWNSYFDKYGVDMIMGPGQYCDVFTYSASANSSIPVRLKVDGEYIDGVGSVATYIPMPKVVVPSGLDKEGRPTAVTFYGRGVPLDKLYDDEYAKLHDLEFLHKVNKIDSLLFLKVNKFRRKDPKKVTKNLILETV